MYKKWFSLFYVHSWQNKFIAKFIEISFIEKNSIFFSEIPQRYSFYVLISAQCIPRNFSASVKYILSRKIDIS